MSRYFRLKKAKVKEKKNKSEIKDMKIIVDMPEKGQHNSGAITNSKNAGNNIDKVTTAYSAAKLNLGISSNVMDNNAYAGHGKTVEDVMLEAGSKDVITRRNYMAVMSNTMSKEDFAKLQKDGIHPANTKIETVVTIIDHIKVALIKGGTEVPGYTDTLSAEKFTAITGDKVMAGKLSAKFRDLGLPATDENIGSAQKAWEKAHEISLLSEGQLKYMVENHLPPTIENLYLAKYSGGNGAGKQGQGYFAQDAHDAVKTVYFAKKADSFNWDNLKPQIEKVVHEAGYENNKETFNSGCWLIEKGIPLTGENLDALMKIQSLKLPPDKDRVAAAITSAIADGKNPLTADLLNPLSDMEKALGYVNDIKEIEKAAVEEVVSKNQVINLKNLITAQKNYHRENPVQEPLTEKIIAARRTLFETSLIMTATANLRLLRSGFNIEIAPLEQLVSKLKEAEYEIKSHLVGTTAENEAVTESRYSLYNETISKISEIPAMPAALVGRMPQIFTMPEAPLKNINEIHASGTALKAAYEKAGEHYEQLMTSPRRDMGDSIIKAFRNVDDILNSAGLYVNEANRRAVRILAYNSMDINPENINAVKEKDALLQDVLNKMKPGAVLQIIREGLNPLTMSLEELSAVLNGKNESVADTLDDYSHFLAKLDRKGDILETEREVYIGVYRLLRQIEKGESAAVGSLINAEMDFSLGNLLTALRTNRRQGMDYTVDDNLNGVRTLRTGDTLEMSLEKLSEVLQANNQTDVRENLKDIIEKLDLAENDEAYISEQLKDIQAVKNIENEIIQTLLNFNQPVSVNNLIAASWLLKKPGELHKKAQQFAKESDLDAILSDARDNLTENFIDEESASSAYDNLNQVMAGLFSQMSLNEEANMLDIRELSSMCRQINLSAAMKSRSVGTGSGDIYREERYDIPVEIDGEITAVNLLLCHNSKTKGSVFCKMDSTAYGMVTADFNVTNGMIEGYIAANNAEGLKKLSTEADNLYTSLKNIPGLNLEIGNIHFIKSSTAARINNNENNISTEEQDQSMDAEKVSNKELYLVAKAFISFIKREINEA